MSKTKIDFIIDLLNDKRLNSLHKEKLFSLAHEELKKLEINDEIILTKLEKLEKIMYNGSSLKKVEKGLSTIIPVYNTSNVSTQSVSLPKFIDPRNTAKFLNHFNQNIVLKSTTHEIDENLFNSLLDELKLELYSYENHLAKIEGEFQKLTSKYYINIGLIGKLKEYLFSTYNKGWSEENIKVGWKSKEVAEWCKDHPGRCPNAGLDLNYPACPLEEIIELKDGSLLKTFNEVIGQFKSQIEFRDASDLKKIVEGVNNYFFSDYQINTDKMKEGIRFYSDVEKVTQAYKNIIRMCIDHWEKTGKSDNNRPQFTVSLFEKRIKSETAIIFSIKHTNSIFGKTAVALTERYGSSFNGLISKQINGLCDLVLKAEFPNKAFAEVSIWPTDKRIKQLNSFAGVQYDLKFFRLS